MNKLLWVAESKDQILTVNHKVFCPVCGDRFFSAFDKLYIEAYGTCYVCDNSDKETLELQSDNIFSILE